jgi:hypothetical protein
MHDCRGCGALYAKAMLAAMAALIMLAADTTAQELRRAQTREEVAPRRLIRPRGCQGLGKTT